MREVPPLRDYQIADLTFLMMNPRCGLLSDPGTGKTPPVCVFLYWLWRDHKTRSIWVMPKSLLKKNRDEALRFSEFEESDVVIVDGSPKKREELMASDAKVFLFGFDMFARSWEKMKELHPDFNCVVVDEFHMGFGGNDSQRTKELYRCMKKTRWFVAMTGTLINGKLTSAYPFVHIIEPRYYGSYFGFENYHGMRDLDGNLIGWHNHEKLSRILSHHAIRRTFEMVYGKEAKEVQVERVAMSDEQREYYKEFEKNALIELDDGFIDGSLPGVNVIRCRQIMAHPEHLPHPRDPKAHVCLTEELTGKDQRLLIHLADHDNTGKPLIIFASLVREIERIFELVRKEGFTVGMIHGGVSAARRSAIDEEFRKGNLQVIVGSPATAAVGFNWQHWGPQQQEVDHVIFVSLDYMDTSYLQAYRRMMRDVRKTPLLITVLEYEQSIDQRIFEIVRRKSEDANKVDASRPVLDFRAKDEKRRQTPVSPGFTGSPLDLLEI